MIAILGGTGRLGLNLGSRWALLPIKRFRITMRRLAAVSSPVERENLDCFLVAHCRDGEFPDQPTSGQCIC
jgi:hypothetical protein